MKVFREASITPGRGVVACLSQLTGLAVDKSF